MMTGVLLGLAAAVCQSLSYVASRTFAQRFQGRTVTLLVLSHLIMGAVSALGLAVVWPGSTAMPAFAAYRGPLFFAAGFYLLGQAGLFLALRRVDASRVSPLLGLKLLLLATISVCFLGESYSAWQWVAVVLTLLSAGMLNRSGGRLPWVSLGWVLVACLGYSLSDLNIKMLVDRFAALGLVRASLVSAFLSYILCGAGALPILLLRLRPSRAMWLYAAPFAVAWLGAMLFLFACFGSIGVVFGNIVQSTRGVMSIAIGAAIARAGYVHLEQNVPREILVRRSLAAVLMIVAIALFSLS